MSKRKDWVRLRHMLDAGQEALSFAEGKSRESLDVDRQLVLALVKSIEILGEASSRVSKETRDSHPQIPWQEIIAMRNRLIHAYYEINLDLVWDTLTADLPPLVRALETLLR
ncbi:MAG: DUF86 domain-containing protein [Nitrospinota bacterium]